MSYFQFVSRYYKNSYYAKVGGITTKEMNRLELEFLFRIDFRMSITAREFEDNLRYLENAVTVKRES